jgi:hypothetical protein
MNNSWVKERTRYGDPWHVVCKFWRSGEVMSLDETFQNLSSFLNSLDAEGEQKFELSHSLVIICPDCGKNIAFRGRCPKCGGNSWIPAGHAGGIFERMKAQRWRAMIHTGDEAEAESFPAPNAVEEPGGSLPQ